MAIRGVTITEEEYQRLKRRDHELMLIEQYYENLMLSCDHDRFMEHFMEVMRDVRRR